MEADGAPGIAAGKRPRGRPRRDAEMIPLILDAAERLLARQGTLSVSIRAIAREAGVPHSAIYRYFDGKDDVLRQVHLRGRERQRQRDEAARTSGRPFSGAVDWVMNQNRCYAMAIARAAMEGETGSSLGLDSGESAAQHSLRGLESLTSEYAPGGEHDPRLVVAATMALALGWAIAEEWIVDAAGLGERDRGSVRAELDDIFAALVAMARPVDQAASKE